jgi:Fur family peroxide stress response transcriptional regulator
MQRRAVFEAILEREDHPTADQVYDIVRADAPEIARMTVYRILGTLVRIGLVAKTCHPGSSARFDPKIRQHHHLVCLDCNGIIDLEDERLNNVPRPDVRRLGFEITDYHIHFRGRCAACRQKLAQSAAGGRWISSKGRGKTKRKGRS